MSLRLAVKMTPDRGRGVFANCRIRKGEIIEIAPVLVLSHKDAKILGKTKLISHCYHWGVRGNQTALVLGHGCLYNHSYGPNMQPENCLTRKVILFRAIKDIARGEEITFNYNGSPNNQSPLWFTADDWGRGTRF